MFDDFFTLFGHEPSSHVLLDDWNPSEAHYPSDTSNHFQTWVDPVECIGNPIGDAQFWQQQSSATSCAIVSQISIYESITGHQLPEHQVCEIAEANGWYDPETGTTPDQVGKVLNGLGIPTEQHYDATLIDLANALENGDKVIVGLDANEIWKPATDASGTPLEQPNAGHAVWVTGMTQAEDGSVKILLNDSGSPNGQMSEVDAKDFINAWQDYGNFLVVAHPPHSA